MEQFILQVVETTVVLPGVEAERSFTDSEP